MPQLNAALTTSQRARASYSELKWRIERLEREVYPSGFDIQLWMIGRETRHMRVIWASELMLLQDPVGLNWTPMCGAICPNISLRRYTISTQSISKRMVPGMYYIPCGIYGRKSSRYHPCFIMLLVAASALKKQRRNWVFKFKWNWEIFQILNSGHLNSMSRSVNAFSLNLYDWLMNDEILIKTSFVILSSSSLHIVLEDPPIWTRSCFVQLFLNICTREVLYWLR